MHQKDRPRYSVFDLFWLIILVAVVSSILVFLEGQYGFENFCADAAAVGVDGLILPDMPEHEFETEYRELLQ